MNKGHPAIKTFPATIIYFYCKLRLVKILFKVGKDDNLWTVCKRTTATTLYSWASAHNAINPQDKFLLKCVKCKRIKTGTVLTVRCTCMYVRFCTKYVYHTFILLCFFSSPFIKWYKKWRTCTDDRKNALMPGRKSKNLLSGFFMGERARFCSI